jgi:uncharacterized protein YndB with AHSA1/START domain
MTETSSPGLALTLPSDREIVLTRVFDAPRELVFEAWTKPEHVRRWWGLRDSTLPVCEIDLQPGGSWHYVTRDPEGNEYPFKGAYLEVVAPERLVHTWIFDVEPFSDHEAMVTVTFAETVGQTTVTETTLYANREDRDGHLESGMEHGAAESCDRLADLLEILK